MATPVGVVFLFEGIVLCSTRFFGLHLEDPALRCLWSVHRKSKLLLATMTYVFLQWCRRKFFLCSPCGFCPVSPSNRAYVRFLGRFPLKNWAKSFLL
uniref:Uncharacterized protein n=1 Tax=Oryza barthii TaxID=65489 RepID=A0A0D3HBI7_9ORYZ